MYRRLLYRSYRRLFGIRHWFRRRFTRAGGFAFACLILAGAIGIDTNQTTVHQAFTFLIAVFLASTLWIVVRSSKHKGIEAFRRLPRFATVGSPVSYVVSLTNRTARAYRGMTLLERLEDPRPSMEEFVAVSLKPHRGFSAWLDELLGYSRWWNAVARRQPASVDERALPILPANGVADVRFEFTPRRRGRVHFTGLTLARSDVFGLMRNHWNLTLPQSFVILPKRYWLPRIPLPGTREYQPLGVALASAVGQSDEFVALRDYRPGDPLRHIHWASVAKTDRLVVREHEDEFFVRHALILDTFGEAVDEAVFEEAVSVAASFVCTIQTQESLLDLLFVGPEAYCFTAGRGLGHADQLLEILAGVDICHSKPFPSLEALVLRHAARVSGSVCVFLAWDEPRQRLVRLLRSLSVPLRVCVVSDVDNLDPGPMRDDPQNFHVLKVGKVQEALARL